MRVLASIVLGFLLALGLGSAIDATDWPVFRGSGLTEGSLLVAWPVLSVIAYLLLVLWPMARDHAQTFECSTCHVPVPPDARVCPSCGFGLGPGGSNVS